MISNEEVRAAVQRMRRIGSDTQDFEVKEAVQGIPKSLPETISAFANHKGA